MRLHSFTCCLMVAFDNIWLKNLIWQKLLTLVLMCSSHIVSNWKTLNEFRMTVYGVPQFYILLNTPVFPILDTHHCCACQGDDHPWSEISDIPGKYSKSTLLNIINDNIWILARTTLVLDSQCLYLLSLILKLQVNIIYYLVQNATLFLEKRCAIEEDFSVFAPFSGERWQTQGFSYLRFLDLDSVPVLCSPMS